MDIMEKRTIEITSLAMNGLSARHKAIASNVANAGTAGYKRIDVTFEEQLQKIIQTDEAKKQNKPNSNAHSKVPLKPGNSEMNYSDFNPNIITSKNSLSNANGNNVNLESEMAELAKNGMKYNALAALQAKSFRGLAEVIQGGR